MEFDKRKLLLYGGIAVGVYILYRMFAGGGSSTTAQNIAAVGQTNALLSSATVADNQNAYGYLAQTAKASYAAKVGIMNAQTGGITAGYQALATAATTSATSTAAVASYEAQSAQGIFEARMNAATQLNASNNALSAFLADQETQRQWQNIQLPLQSMWANTVYNTVLSNNATQTNIAQIEANRDITINNAWSNAAITQAKYAYKTSLGQQGALGWGNLALGKSAAFQYGPIKAASGSSSNSQGGTSQAHT